MSRRARARANARPWEQLRDADDDSDIEALLADDDGDQHLREQAWQQHDAEQARAQGAQR